MRIYVTTQALTRGIFVYDNAYITHDGRAHVQLPCPGLPNSTQHFYFNREGTDWHKSPAAAIAKAQQMRQAKIQSLQNQIHKLHQIQFAIPDKPAA